jgi:GT2 family glycosyltransferase
MLLSVVIVSWNTKELLEDCIASIYSNPPGGDFEVWVVDNASTDGSASMVRERFPQVKLIESAENLGFARGNNLAIRQSTGKFILLLNPDTKVLPGALEILIRFMEQHPQAGGAGPFLLNPDNSLQVSCYPLPTLSREFWRLLYLDSLWPYGSYQMDRWDREVNRPVGVLKGACIILSRAALDEVGLLDEEYFIYTEEVDLCFRLHQRGWPLYWVPGSQVIHYGGQSVHQAATTEMFLYLYQTKIYYFRKHYGALSGLIFKLILAVVILPRVMISLLPRFKRSPEQSRYLNLSKNYRRLLRLLPGM